MEERVALVLIVLFLFASFVVVRIFSNRQMVTFQNMSFGDGQMVNFRNTSSEPVFSKAHARRTSKICVPSQSKSSLLKKRA
jgi:hypothetical protein